MALFLPLFALPMFAPTAQAAAPPATQPDNFSLYWEAKFYTTLPVLNNDTSSDGGTLTVVAKTKSSSVDSPVRIRGGQLQIKLCACDDGKILTLQYKAGEGDAVSAWTSVEIRVKHVKPITSRRLHHHRARFTNRNPFKVRIKIYYSLYYLHRSDRIVKVPANSSVVIRRPKDGQRIPFSAVRRPHNWRTPVTVSAKWM